MKEPSIAAIEEKAAEWFGLCEIGLTPAQERDFLQWLEADPRHGEAVREMDETWDFLDRLKDVRRPAAVAGTVKASSPVRWHAPVWLAAAAAVALIGAGAWRWQSVREKNHLRHVATEAGGLKRIELPDGSQVYVNANSSVDVRFTASERSVRLERGEAHFAVAKDPARPFVVTAGEVSVRAVGTAFNVRRGAQAVEIVVAEGKVRIDDTVRGTSLLTAAASPAANAAAPPPDSGLLVAGQRAVVPLNTESKPQPAEVMPVAPPEMAEALAWRTRQLDFDLTPLADVVAEFNRYNTHQLVIEDPDLGRERFGGSFRADNYRVFVKLLERRFNVVAEPGDDRTVLRRRR
jgi:transmembrane sensor